MSPAPRQAGLRGHTPFPTPSLPRVPTPGSGTHLLPPWSTGIRNKTQKLRPHRLAQPRGMHQERLTPGPFRLLDKQGERWGPSVQRPRQKPPQKTQPRCGSSDPPTADRTQRRSWALHGGLASSILGVPQSRAASLTSIEGHAFSHVGAAGGGHSQRRRQTCEESWEALSLRHRGRGGPQPGSAWRALGPRGTPQPGSAWRAPDRGGLPSQGQVGGGS